MNLTPQIIKLRTNNLFNASQHFLTKYDQSVNLREDASFNEFFNSNLHYIESYFRPFLVTITHIINLTEAGIKEPKLIRTATNAIYYLHEACMDFEQKIAEENNLPQNTFRKKGIEVLNSWCEKFSNVAYHLINLAEREIPKLNIVKNLERKALFYGFNQSA